MAMCRGIVRCLTACGFALAISLPLGALAQETRIPLNQSPLAVEQLLSNGQNDAALEIASAALQVEPNNPDFLLALARTQVARGQFDAAIDLARRAYQLSDVDNVKFIAAKTVAQAQYALNNLTRTQIWLRRAYQFAPNQELAANVGQDFQNVSRQNPWSTTLRFGITPTSNINGASDEVLYVGGLPFTQTALSGLRISGGVDASYKLHMDETSATLLLMSAEVNRYRFSSAARKNADDKTESDYATDYLSFGLQHKRILTAGGQPIVLGLNYGLGRTAGAIKTRSLTTSFQQGWDVGPRDSVSISGYVRNTLDYDTDDTTVFKNFVTGVTGQWSHSFANDDVMSFRLGRHRSTSEDVAADYDSLSYGLGYNFAKPVYGMRFGLDASVEYNDYASSIFATVEPGPRNDRSVSLGATVNFTNIEYYGFQPVINFEMTEVESNISLHNRKFATIGFDLKSSF